MLLKIISKVFPTFTDIKCFFEELMEAKFLQDCEKRHDTKFTLRKRLSNIMETYINNLIPSYQLTHYCVVEAATYITMYVVSIKYFFKIF